MGAHPNTKGRAKCVALVAETFDQARDMMIFGDSGIMECYPPARPPPEMGGREKTSDPAQWGHSNDLFRE